ncbi:MAG TPA: TrkH family potassium uptake protein [Candidatus Cloacimonadota bacterium]|nr:TrkH family potassium uptake protein [Candidatus Cloacimonadota bacterium]
MNNNATFEQSGKSIFLRLNYLSNMVLNLIALFNVFMFVFNVMELRQITQHHYTLITSCIIIFYWITNYLKAPEKIAFYDLIPDLIFIALGLFVTRSDRAFQLYILGRQTYILIKKQAVRGANKKFLEKLSDNPPVLVLYSFFITIFIGSLLLLLPAATAKGEETTMLGALFTSTSATCVTGLIIYDTGTHFTYFGQLIILFLIQVGGLGIMTISSAFAVMLGQKLSLKSENMMQNVVGESNKLDMINLVKNIMLVTFIFELIGAMLLYITFAGQMFSTTKAIYYAIFHSISAFCNAGFSLFSDSFMAYRSSFNINFVITALIICGGIGFPVLVDIKKNFMNKFSLSRFSLHSKIVFASTLALLVFGTVAFFISEYHSQMDGMSFKERIFASYFQSVTTRTAGFNTIDIAQISKGSAFISIILMFIGASPGSTGGGLKTTTFMIIFVSVLSLFQGNRDVNIFQRKVSNEIIKRVMTLIALSVSVLTIMIFLLLLFEPFGFEQLVFEAFSAFGTVGLSMGITPSLSGFGKVIIIILMYLGRVGLLTMIYALSANVKKTNFSYTEEKISIG